jgi:hypothetical protein
VLDPLEQAVFDPRRSLKQAEFATLEWEDWSNNKRLLGPIGNIPHGRSRSALLCVYRGARMAA